MTCAGSIQLSRGLPNVSTKYAEEGTRAHAVAELCLSSGKDAAEYVGERIEGEIISEEMAEHVQTFVDYARSHMGEGYVTWIEQKFSLAALNPPEPMFGTSDVVAYDPSTRTLYVDDLKYGQGVVVEVLGSEQLRYYALGALLALDTHKYPVEKIVISIVQPRAMHADGPIRSETLTVADLMDFAQELIAAAHRTQAPDAPLVAGSHCRFCPASGICPAQREHVQALAQIEFDVLPEQFTPPAPELLPPEMLGDIITKLPILKAWMTAVEQHGQRLLEEGVEVPGHKLVARRKNRKWADPKETERWLRREGFSDEDFRVPGELKSPAQIEKLVGKKNFPAEMAVKPEGGVQMVPVQDARPAIARGEEFAALPAGSGDEE